MNRAAFLEAIRAEPDEMAHRLVFADWLDEQGEEARAEFIRLQVRRDGLPLAHPLTRESLRREGELIDLHGGDWQQELPPGVRRVRYHRGFIEEAAFTAEEFLAVGPALFSAVPLRRLQLRGTYRLPELLTPAVVGTFSRLLARITVLDLNRDYLGEAAGAALLSLPTLPTLRGLHLRNNSLTAAGLQTLAASGVLDALETLEVTPPSTGSDALLVLLHSPRLTRLHHLLLAGTRMGDRLVRLLTGSPLLPRLRSLSLGHGNIGPDGVAELTRCGGLANLEQLDLSFNSLGVDGARAVGRGRFPALAWLNLSRTEAGDEGARAMAGSALVNQLSGLDLSLCRIGPAGGRALVRMPKETRIQTLDLIYNPLGPDAEAALVARFGSAVLLTR
jgi:uncharacterized protein (TIGR02996 family)